MKKIMMITIFIMVLLAGCSSQICAKCGKNITGTAYRNVISEEEGAFCEDCASYEYGADMNMYAQ